MRDGQSVAIVIGELLLTRAPAAWTTAKVSASGLGASTTCPGGAIVIRMGGDARSRRLRRAAGAVERDPTDREDATPHLDWSTQMLSADSRSVWREGRDGPIRDRRFIALSSGSPRGDPFDVRELPRLVEQRFLRAVEAGEHLKRPLGSVGPSSIPGPPARSSRRRCRPSHPRSSAVPEICDERPTRAAFRMKACVSRL